MHGAIGYVMATLIGLLVGGTELAYRYRDNPGRTLVRPASVTYAAVNGSASGLALYAIRAADWTFGTQRGSGLDLLRVLVAGLGAVTLFRTKLFSAASKDGQSYSWGPSRLLEQLLAISDTQADRQQATDRSRTVARVMTGVAFDRACTALPTYALGLLENVSAEEQDRLGKDVKALVADITMSDGTKALQLGVALIRLTGPDLLERAVADLRPVIAMPDTSSTLAAPKQIS